MPTSIGSSKAIIAYSSIPIAKVRAGNDLVYSAAVVTYYVDVDSIYTEDVDSGESCLSPKTFVPGKEGWEFAGWRQDTEAGGDVLDELVMDDDPITLYAVFLQDVTLSYDGNGSNDGDTEPETKQRYYNNGAVTNPDFIIKDNGFNKKDYNFLRWRLNGTSGEAYSPGDSITLDTDAVMFAEWKAVAKPFYLNTSVTTFTASCDYGKADFGLGIYSKPPGEGWRFYTTNITVSPYAARYTTDKFSRRGCDTFAFTLYANAGVATKRIYVGSKMVEFPSGNSEGKGDYTIDISNEPDEIVVYLYTSSYSNGVDIQLNYPRFY